MIDHVILVPGGHEPEVVAGHEAVGELRGVGAARIPCELKGHRGVVRLIRLQREIVRSVLLRVHGLRARNVARERQARVVDAAVGAGHRQGAEASAVFVAERRPAVAPLFGLAVVFDRIPDQIEALRIEQKHGLGREAQREFGAVEEEVAAAGREEGHHDPGAELHGELELHQLHADAARNAHEELGLHPDAAPFDV